MVPDTPVVTSHFWQEVAEAADPYQSRLSRCAGYDVYGDLLGRISWPEYLYLLLRHELPPAPHATALQDLAVALANAGPREPAVRAAINGGAGGSTFAACLMSALAVGAGRNGGAREVFTQVQLYQRHGQDRLRWPSLPADTQAPAPEQDVWPAWDHPPGFHPGAVVCALPVRQTLDHLAQILPAGALQLLQQQRPQLEARHGMPLALTAVAAAALFDLGFDADTAEVVFLLLRLPGAGAHALEQSRLGWRALPFARDGVQLLDDPGPAHNGGSPG